MKIKAFFLACADPKFTARIAIIRLDFRAFTLWQTNITIENHNF
jgi:hypothetical protein